MKKMILVLLLGLSIGRGFAQLSDIEQLKLNIEKLVQMKMMLSSMYDGYKTLDQGYTRVVGYAKGNFDIQKSYLDELLQVSAPVKNYPHVQSVREEQATMLAESYDAYLKYLKSGLFKADELANIKARFDELKKLVSKQVDQLNTVLTPGSLRMSDQERMSAIDRIDKDVGIALATLRELIAKQSALAVQRGQQKKDRDAIKALYGIKN